MQKHISTFFLFLLSIFGLHAQNNCPLNIKVSTEVGTCYNNCAIDIALVDKDNNPLDSLSTDLSDFKYFCINTYNWDTTYSISGSFTVAPGTYKVGVQAICYYSTSSDSMYIRMEKDTTITTITTYETPILSVISHNATSTNDYGTIPSLTCLNTGRIQLKITGGSFPYYVKLCDESGVPLDTLVFHDHMYSGEDDTKYDYKDYYSIDSLAPGKYIMYVWDGCEYYLPMVLKNIETANLPYIENVCWYYYSGNNQNRNVIKLDAKVQSPCGYYAYSIPDVIEYRFIYPEIAGVRDTTAWKHLPPGNYSGEGSRTILLYDTAYSASRYCDLFDEPIVFQARNTLCEENFFTTSYTYEKPNERNFRTQSVFHTDSSIVTPVQYDSCGYWSQKTIAYGHYEHNISYTYRSSSYRTCDGFSNYKNHYYTYPLYWVYTDTSTHNIIKIDTITSITATSTLSGSDIVRLYGSFNDSGITLPVQRTLYDGMECELYSRFDLLTFKKIEQVSGGAYNERYFSTSINYSAGDYCCDSPRSVQIYEHNNLPMFFNGDAVVELITSPFGNKYNFTATFSQASRSWTIVKDSLSNLATINASATNLNIRLADYCLPSGTYTFRITIPCKTYTVSYTCKFQDQYEYTVSDTAVYECIPDCTEMTIKPVAGKYSVLRHNVATSNSGGLIIGQPYTLSEEREASFQIISGPTGGYSSTAVSIGGEMRVTMPGTYVICMMPSGSYLCDPEIIYDTLYFSGGTVEYDYDYAYVCDSLSTIGYARIKGKNGTPPYSYTLYSAPNMTGTVLGENTSGNFDDIPLRSGQQISARITDACMASFHVNFYVFDMEKVDKSWFTGGIKVAEVCEGSYITVYALGKEDIFSYIWTGPNGFYANNKDANVFIPRDAENGYYKVTFLNTGCSNPITDSVYINVSRAAKVVIAKDTTICPGKEVQLNFTSSGTGNVYYTIGHEENSVVNYQNYSNNDTYNYYPSSHGIFWVHEVSDDLCVYSIPEDTIHITLKDHIATACDVLTMPDTVCLDSNAIVSAFSVLDVPYIVHWYEDFEQLHLLKTDTIQHSSERSHYFFPHLDHDTTLYVSVFNDTHCETHYSTITRWMNMHAGNSSVRCGESIKLYDSGGYESDYKPNENTTHIFTSTDGSPLTLKFNDFNTEEEYDKLIVFTGTGINPDSIIATLSGDLSGNLPVDIISDGASMTLWFLSNGYSEHRGWDAVISNNPYTAAVTAIVTDSVKVQLSPVSANPVQYNGSITMKAVATGGGNQQFEYCWFSSNDGINWYDEHIVIAHDTSYHTYTNLTAPLYVKVVVKDVSANTCGGKDSATYIIPIAHVKLSLNLTIQTDDPCNSKHKALLTIKNDGEQNAEDIVCHLHVPNNFYLSNSEDTVIRINILAAHDSITDTIRLMLLHRPSIDTTYIVKAQIWSCLQGDSVPEVIYGDWDWQGTPRQADEDSANVHVLPVFSAGDYHLTTINDDVCFNDNAVLSAFSDIPTPQYFKWFSDPDLMHLIQTDTIFTLGDYAHLNINNLQANTTVYVTVQNTEKCPPMANGIMDFKYDLPITDTVIMNNGITKVGMNDHIKFYDTGGPDNDHDFNEDIIHTFSTDEGVLKIVFRNISTKKYNYLYIYDGPSINSPLIATLYNYTGAISFTSTTGGLTLRFVSTLNSSNVSFGWDAEIVNSQTFKSAGAIATVKAPLSPVNISTTDAEICYGEDALLTASSNIAFPQYHTWFDHNMQIVKHDTIHSGYSSLRLPEQISNSEYFVSIINDTTCTLRPLEQSTVFMTADLHLKTTEVHPNEQIKFYDNGGPESNYNYRDTIITHTFKAQAGQQVAIQFNNNNYNPSGYIRLYDGESSDDTHLIGTLSSSSNYQRTYISTQNSMTISFKLTNNYRGWDALVYAVDTVLYCPLIPHPTTSMTPGNSYRFLDDGGSNSDYSCSGIKTSCLHTFRSSQGKIILNVQPYALGNNDTLYIYRGNSDVSSQLLYKLTGTSSSFSKTIFTEDSHVTFKFVNSGNSYGQGWSIILQSLPSTAMAQANVKLRVTPVNTEIIATNDTICHGETAILRASSPIAYPQYFTWYNSEGTNILLRDTIIAGGSALELPNQKIKENFFITINNVSTCPLIVAKDTLINRSIMSSSLHNNQTVFITPTDKILFTDEGGLYGNYYETPIGEYITTFTALQGKVKADFPTGSDNYLNNTDTLYVYDGQDGDSLLFKATSTGFRNKIFESSGNSLTFKFVNNSTYANYGWRATITSIPEDTITQAWVYIRKPGSEYSIIAINDTICYDNTARLHAAVPELGFPQYYTWISQDFKNVVYQDTVNGIDKTKSTLVLGNQQKDTMYHVTIKTDTICPMRYEDSVYTPHQSQYDFLLSADKHNNTTHILCSDSISFFDEGGKTKNYFTNNAHFVHRFNSTYNEPIQLCLTSFITESNDCLIIYDGNNTSAPQLAKLGGYLISSMPATYTAYSGSLTVEWITNSSGVRQGWEGYIMTTDYCPVSKEMSTAEVHVLSEIPVASISHTTCQSTTPISFMGFNNLDISTAGYYTIDSVFISSSGCDSAVTLYLTVIQNYEHEVTDTVCSGDLPYVWNGVTFTAGGSQSATLSTVLGCDSVVNMTLIVNQAYTGVDAVSVYDTICSSDLPYVWNGLTIDATGSHTITLTTAAGCDSIVTLYLEIDNIDVYVTGKLDETCGNDGSVTVMATGKAPFEYSLNGLTFQSSPTFTGLASGNYTITVRDAKGCTATTDFFIAAATTPTFTITCPPNLRDTLAFGDCAMKIYPTALGTPSAYHSLGWPFSITNDASADSLYHEGDNIVTWIMTDLVCGFADTCYQHILIVFPKCPDAVDCEGNVYHGVRIGCDCWTQRNLESTKYSDCSDIPCVYEYVSADYPNAAANVDIFGRLYCFEAAVRDSADNGHGHIQGICPAGWYLPTPEKYEELNTYGAEALESPLYWITGGGTNTTGFTALPAGYYNGSINRYEELLGAAYFWSTANTGSSTSSSAYSMFLNCDYILQVQTSHGNGYSVRCIKEKE